MLLLQTVFSVLFYIRRKVILSSFRWHDYFVCRVKRFRVMVDFVRDRNKFQILWITVSCSAFDGGLFVCLNAVKQARWKRYFYSTNRNKRSVFLLTDHFVIDECKLCNKEWKPLATVQCPTACVNWLSTLQIEKIKSGLSVAHVAYWNS